MATGPSYFRELANELIVALIAGEQKRHDAWRDELITKNRQLGGSADGFLYGGTFHTHLHYGAIREATKKMVHLSLRPEVQVYMASLRTMKDEEKRLSHGLHWIFNFCQTTQDCRDMIPNSTSALSPQLSRLERTRPLGCLIKPESLDQMQYENILDMLETYAAHALI